jgi:fucose permease
MAWLRVAVLLSGFGCGVMNGGTNTLVADISPDGRTAGLSKLAVFFGFGAVGVPLTLGTLLGQFSYTTILATVGALGLLPLLATTLCTFPTPKQAQGFPVAEVKSLVRDPLLLTFGLMLFLESGMEITVGGWTTTFFREELLATDRQALTYLALFWFGMMVARMTLGATLRRFVPPRILVACITIGLAGSLLTITTHVQAAGAAGVFLIGVGFSATFPIVLGLVADRYAALSGTAFSVVMVMALAGGMTLPYVTGLLAASYGLRSALVIVPTSLVLLVGLLMVASARSTAALRAE